MNGIKPVRNPPPPAAPPNLLSYLFREYPSQRRETTTTRWAEIWGFFQHYNLNFNLSYRFELRAMYHGKWHMSWQFFKPTTSTIVRIRVRIVSPDRFGCCAPVVVGQRATILDTSRSWQQTSGRWRHRKQQLRHSYRAGCHTTTPFLAHIPSQKLESRVSTIKQESGLEDWPAAATAAEWWRGWARALEYFWMLNNRRNCPGVHQSCVAYPSGVCRQRA